MSDLLERAARELLHRNQLRPGHWEYTTFSVSGRRDEYYSGPDVIAGHYKEFDLMRVDAPAKDAAVHSGAATRSVCVVEPARRIMVFGVPEETEDIADAMLIAIGMLCDRHGWEFVSMREHSALMRLWVED